MTRKRLEAYKRMQKKKGLGGGEQPCDAFIHITRSAADDGWTWASTRQKNPAPQRRGGSMLLLMKGADEACSDVSNNAVARPPIRSAVGAELIKLNCPKILF